MKRTILISTLLRIALTTMLTSNLTLKLAAHDLPQDAKCYSMIRASVARSMSDSRNPIDRLRGKSTRSGKSLESAILRTPKQTNFSSVPFSTTSCYVADWNDSKSDVARPLQAIAHGLPLDESFNAGNCRFHRSYTNGSIESRKAFRYQASTPSVTEAAPGLAEEYRPYDLAVRDWRFFPPGFDSKPQAEHVTTSPVVKSYLLSQTKRNTISLAQLQQNVKASLKSFHQSSQRLAVAVASQHLQNFHGKLVGSRFLLTDNFIALICAVRSPLPSGASLALAKIELDWPHERTTISTTPFFNTPPFVYFENAHGLRLVLTEEQARARGLILHQYTDSQASENASPTSFPKIAESMLQHGWTRLSNLTASLQHIVDRAQQLWIGIETHQSTRIAREPTLIQ